MYLPPIFILLTALKTSTSWANQPCPELIKNWINTNAPNYNIQGLSLSIIEAKGKICTLAYVFRSKLTHAKVNEKTLFNAASISKPLTASVALKVFSQNNFDINKPINNYLKSWKLQAPEDLDPEKVTLKNLLNHSSGLTGFRCIGYKQNQPFPTLLEALDGKPPANTPAVTLVSKPNTQYLYSPAAYMIVEQSLTDILRKPFSQIMKEELLNPLLMTHSTFEQPLPKKYFKNLAYPYLPNGELIAGGPLNFAAKAAGGLWTTAADLSRFLLAIQHSLKAMESTNLTKLYLTPLFSKNWGLGIQVNLDKNGSETEKGSYFGHGGFNSGYLSYMLASKDEPVGFAVLINTAPLMTTKGEVVQFGFIKALNKQISTLYDWH
ncbi:MAG: beta-lactamase family protein [Tatlockia sp.]|nr:beta-lactamase family protein [Tatlockia sp.]